MTWSIMSVMKIRQDNDMTDRIGAFYIKNDTKLLWLIELGAVYGKN